MTVMLTKGWKHVVADFCYDNGKLYKGEITITLKAKPADGGGWRTRFIGAPEDLWEIHRQQEELKAKGWTTRITAKVDETWEAPAVPTIGFGIIMAIGLAVAILL